MREPILPSTVCPKTISMEILVGDTDAVADMGAYEYNPNSPSIAVSERIVSFAYDWLKPHLQALLIRNCGGGTLQWQIFEDCPWLQVSPTNGASTGQINEVTLTVDPNGLALGYYSCTLQVHDPHASNSLVTVLVTMGLGEILRVPNDFFTIQAAIDEANDYDVVLVADGNYSGEGNQDIDFSGKAITVRSENGPENCIINCQGDYDCAFLFQSGETAHSRVQGFTIVNRDSGGAIYCEQSSPAISNCILKSYSFGRQAGIYCHRAHPIITNCTISGYANDRVGGGIVCSSSSPTITNCIITGNKSICGGGIGCINYSSPTITNCTIKANSATFYGGAIFCSYHSNPTITNCTISSNVALGFGSDGGQGGGIYCEQSSPAISNCTFAGNSATNGNALTCDSHKQKYPSNLQMTNCILADGGNEIWNNDGSTITINYSNIQGGWPGEGNIDADPCFISPCYWADVNDINIIVEPNDPNAVWIDGDYHLLRTSPCIDAATDAGVYTDIEGNPRPFDFPGVDNNGELPDFDMGAYEATAQEAELMLLPGTINRSSRRKRVLAWLRLPEGITKDQIDTGSPLVLYPGNIQAIRQYVFQNRRREVQCSIFAFFNKKELINAVDDNGRVQLHVLGHFANPGQYFYGSDTIKIITKHPHPGNLKRKNIAFH
ncbi:MAG: right-handed parallel beta-helix repeat-containing protein [Planctomycetota bacterium]